VVFTDPTGAVAGTWQPGTHKGAQAVNQANTWSWSELYSRDLNRALEFYKTVFGYELEAMEMGSGPAYTVLKVGGRAVAGAMDMNPLNLDAHVPAHWLSYFTVTDLQATLDKVKELGGKALTDAMNTPMGPFAVIEDSTGAAFAVIQINSQD